MKNIMILLIIAVSGICLGQFTAIDSIQFGNFYSEAMLHTCTFTNTTSITGGLGMSAREIGIDGSIRFTIACDPSEQNYLTVKLWGSQVVEGRQYLYLYDSQDNQLGEYYAGIPESEIMYWDDRPSYQGRFVYSTYMIPQNLTSGRTSVTLKLANAQLQVYHVYTHLDPFFVPEGETQGTNPGAGVPVADGGVDHYTYLVSEAEEALDEIMTWQKWGDSWDAAVAAGDAPGWMTGATTWDGRGGNAAMTEQEWKEDLYVRLKQGNCDAMKVPMLYAKAYNAPWSKYYQDPELIERIVAALDWYCIVQGANGAFDNPWGLRWIGGPDRVNGSGCLEGFGVRGPAEAFLLVQNEISAVTLDEIIDNDGDQVADVTRRDAWEQLFQWSRDHLISDRGHATNQDIAQQYAAWQHNEALKVLDPAKALDRSTMLELAYRASGILPAGFYDDVTHWFSYKGVSCEGPGTSAGGYCGGYGEAPLAYAMKYCDTMVDSQLNAQFAKMFSAWSRFCYTGIDENGNSVLMNEMVINNRPNRHVGEPFPGMTSIVGTVYAASQLGSQEAKRMVELFVDNNRLFAETVAELNQDPSPHFSNNAEGFIDLVGLWNDAAAQTTAYRLPMEEGEGNYAWSDEQAQAVSVKKDDSRMLMSLNWRQPNDDFATRDHDGALATNVARVHYMTDQIDRIANIDMQTPYGLFELYLCEYGDYYIIMNESESNTTYDVALPGHLPDYATDMVTGDSVDISTGTIEIKPMTTIVLDNSAPQFCGDVNTLYLDGDLNKDCRVDLGDFVSFAQLWLQSQGI
ncbi:MAG: hypothetical protein ACIAQZ_01110 [Sedimentisphaeraceae bacterium JB056]